MTVKATGFESFLIDTWDVWEDIDVDVYAFYGCVLKEPAAWPPGKKYDVVIDLEKMIAQVSLDGEELGVHKFEIRIV